jgi:hypothetical protein
MQLLLQSMATAYCVCTIAAACSGYQSAQPSFLDRGMQRYLLLCKQQQADSLEM